LLAFEAAPIYSDGYSLSLAPAAEAAGLVAVTRSLFDLYVVAFKDFPIGIGQAIIIFYILRNAVNTTQSGYELGIILGARKLAALILS
jgi:hypothetical protein